jgi:hypothetical protein
MKRRGLPPRVYYSEDQEYGDRLVGLDLVAHFRGPHSEFLFPVHGMHNVPPQVIDLYVEALKASGLTVKRIETWERKRS